MLAALLTLTLAASPETPVKDSGPWTAVLAPAVVVEVETESLDLGAIEEAPGAKADVRPEAKAETPSPVVLSAGKVAKKTDGPAR